MDVSAGELGDTITLEGVAMPDGVTLLDDPAETVIATISAPRLANEEEESEEIETETEVVGEAGGDAESSSDDAGE